MTIQHTIFDADMTVSDYIYNARKAKGLSVKDIASDICVSSAYLKDIEKGNFDKLPAQTYAVGFVRSYAQALGLDAGEVVARFKEECGYECQPTDLTPVAEMAPAPRMSKWIPGAGGILGIALTWFFMSAGPSMPTQVAEAPALPANVQQLVAEAVVEKPAEVTSDAGSAKIAEPAPYRQQQTDTQAAPVIHTAQAVRAAPTSLFLPAAHAGEEVQSAISTADLLLQANEDSWMKLEEEDGTEVWSGVLREGETYRPQAPKTVFLTTSNASGITVTVSGHRLQPFGSRGEVVSDIKLTSLNP